MRRDKNCDIALWCNLKIQKLKTLTSHVEGQNNIDVAQQRNMTLK